MFKHCPRPVGNRILRAQLHRFSQMGAASSSGITHFLHSSMQTRRRPALSTTTCSSLISLQQHSRAPAARVATGSPCACSSRPINPPLRGAFETTPYSGSSTTGATTYISPARRSRGLAGAWRYRRRWKQPRRATLPRRGFGRWLCGAVHAVRSEGGVRVKDLMEAFHEAALERRPMVTELCVGQRIRKALSSSLQSLRRRVM